MHDPSCIFRVRNCGLPSTSSDGDAANTSDDGAHTDDRRRRDARSEARRAVWFRSAAVRNCRHWPARWVRSSAGSARAKPMSLRGQPPQPSKSSLCNAAWKPPMCRRRGPHGQTPVRPCSLGRLNRMLSKGDERYCRMRTVNQMLVASGCSCTGARKRAESDRGRHRSRCQNALRAPIQSRRHGRGKTGCATFRYPIDGACLSERAARCRTDCTSCRIHPRQGR